uniref:Uncharacterized protein n=1 Tax=Knipowitschia caucasica TaxID=637954 RepID=A0AAV2J921_KNICA
MRAVSPTLPLLSGITAKNEELLTQHGELGPSGSHGRLDGLALKVGVVLDVCPLDQQVVFSFAVVSNNVISGVTCNAQHRIQS